MPRDTKQTASKPSITVGGVTFSSDQVKYAEVEVEGRKITINEQKDKPRTIGFHQDR